MKNTAEFGIIGGGPGGIALPVSQNTEEAFEALSERGVLIFEAGNESVLGSGKLGQYNGIPSNSLPSEFQTLGEGSPLADSLNTPEGRALKAYIDEPEAVNVPLLVVANFHNQIGRVLKDRWQADSTPSQVLTDTKVACAQLVETADGSIGWDIITDEAEKHRVKNLIVATGAQAKLPPSHLSPDRFNLAEDIFNEAEIGALIDKYTAGEDLGIVGAGHSGLLCLAILLEHLEFQGRALRPHSFKIYTNGQPIRTFHDESEIEVIESGSKLLFRDRNSGQYFAETEVCPQTGRAFRYTGARGKAGAIGRRVQAEAPLPFSPFEIVTARDGATQSQDHLIWATGLEANQIPLLDAHGQPLSPLLSKGEYAVNADGLLQQANGQLIPQAGAIGIAGGLLPEPSLGGEALAATKRVRLHSVNFYHQEVARRLLAALA